MYILYTSLSAHLSLLLYSWLAKDSCRFILSIDLYGVLASYKIGLSTIISYNIL